MMNQSYLPQLQRLVVLGTSGSGKTTFARRLAARLDCPHVELDALHWGPGWTARDPDVFYAAVDAATAGPRWVIDGGYLHVRELIWRRATAVVWLDYSFPRVFARALRRTVHRVFTGCELYNGNRETFRHAFLSFDGIPWWVVRSHHRRRRDYRLRLAAPEHAHLQVVAFRRPSEAEQFLASLHRLDCHAASG